MSSLDPLPVSAAVFDHVAVAARQIGDLLPLYEGVLGGEVMYIGPDDPLYGFRVVLVGFTDGSKIELMEPTSGSTFFDSFFRRCPEGGLHHVTFRVPDIDAALRSCTQAGYAVFGLRRKPGWNEFFIHPSTAGGTLVQFADLND